MTADGERALASFRRALEDIPHDHKYWMDADLIAVRQTAAILLDVVKEHPQSPSVVYGLYLFGIAHYHRNELQNAEPGGFMRLFVDLGPQMADLLKRYIYRKDHPSRPPGKSAIVTQVSRLPYKF